MSLCHLYYKKSNSLHKEKLISAFENSTSLDINSEHLLNEPYKFYVVELTFVDKTLSLKIQDIFNAIPHALIYFLIPKEYSLSLFQLAFMVNAKTIITAKQDIDKVILKIKKDYQLHLEYHRGVSLGSSLINHHSYMLFKDSKLSFVSESLLRDFECSSIAEINDKVCSKLDMQELLSSEYPVKKMITKDLKDETTYFVKSIINADENLVSFEAQTEYEPGCGELSYISTRVSFVEVLKDKLLEKMISDKLFTILTIKIQKMSKTLTKSEEESFKKEFLYELELILDIKVILAEYDRDFYVVLFEDITFTKLQDKAENFHLQISNFLNKQKSKYIVSLHVLNLCELELNPVLTTLDNIATDSIELEILEDVNLKYINNLQDNMSEEQIIDYMLDSIFLNTTDLKLLNIYNGMCINTSSKILKKIDNVIYVQIEQIQGMVMDIDKKTVLQSPILTKSIKANIEYINIKERYAILHNFTILDYNPNERQHGRVSSKKIIPVAISVTGSKIKGVIIDISATSIAIKVKKTKSLDNILNKDVGLTFFLESKHHESGSVKLFESATVIHESLDINGYSKLICLFCENVENENILIDYIFNRQKSIIQDMKKMLR